MSSDENISLDTPVPARTDDELIESGFDGMPAEGMEIDEEPEVTDEELRRQLADQLDQLVERVKLQRLNIPRLHSRPIALSA